MKIRAYKGPLTVLGTGVLGFSLLCIVAGIALSDPRVPNVSAIQPQEIVDSAFSNIGTVAALTVEVITEYVFTATPSPVEETHMPTHGFTGTPTVSIPVTSGQATRTKKPGDPAPTSTRTPTRVPTRTPVTPSRTPVPPTLTSTPVPTNTATSMPPTITDTPIPPPTNTDTPPTVPDTDTPVVETHTPAPTQTPVSTAEASS